MKVELIGESGDAAYKAAMIGISLSWASNETRAKEIAASLAHRAGGHNKFLRFLMLYIDVTAARYWWQEAATYGVGVSVQSESTMHTITKGYLSQNDFEVPIYVPTLDNLNNLILRYKNIKDNGYKKQVFRRIKNDLPEGFLQRRIMCVSYAAFQNMYAQRYNHRLGEWRMFLDTVMSQMQHPEFIVKKEEKCQENNSQ